MNVHECLSAIWLIVFSSYRYELALVHELSELMTVHEQPTK